MVSPRLFSVLYRVGGNSWLMISERRLFPRPPSNPFIGVDCVSHAQGHPTDVIREPRKRAQSSTPQECNALVAANDLGSSTCSKFDSIKNELFTRPLVDTATYTSCLVTCTLTCERPQSDTNEPRSKLSQHRANLQDNPIGNMVTSL